MFLALEELFKVARSRMVDKKRGAHKLKGGVVETIRRTDQVLETSDVFEVGGLLYWSQSFRYLFIITEAIRVEGS